MIAAGTKLGPYEVLDFEDKERVARFGREAKLLAALNHPNIAAVFSFEEISSSSSSTGVRHLLVMELVEGETLRQRLAQGALPVRKAVDLGAQIARGLAALAGSSAAGRAVALPSPHGGRRWVPAASVAVALLAVAGSYAVGHWKGKRSIAAVPSFAQLTFRQEPIFKARLAPDGKTVVYSAASSGNTPEIFSLRSDYPGASPRALRAGHLLSISSKGELAVLTHARYKGHSLFEGTLARMPLEGGAPREILDGVRGAEWSPDGTDLALIRDVGGKDRLEFPAGKVLCEASRGPWRARLPRTRS